MSGNSEMAVPLHIQRLERALDLTGFINQIRQTSEAFGNVSDWEQLPSGLSTSLCELAETSDPETADSEPDISFPTDDEEGGWLDGAGLSRSRRLLAADLLASSSSEDGWESPDDSAEPDRPLNQLDLARMLQQHRLQRKLSRQYRGLPQQPGGYLYYSAGLLSELDHHPSAGLAPGLNAEDAENEESYLSLEPGLELELDEDGDRQRGASGGSRKRPTALPEKRTKKALKQERDHFKALASQRRKLWLYIAKKEIGKVQRSMVNGRKDKAVILKRMATGCMRAARQRALQSQKCEREIVWRMKRLTREMQTYWKHYSRVEKETRKRLEKEELEQRRISSELLEAKRQQRKLNFLITQTELYAHFMRPKVAARAGGEGALPGGQGAILGHLEEGQKDARLAGIDDYDCEAAKSLALEHARAAVQRSRQHTDVFDRASGAAQKRPARQSDGTTAKADQSQLSRNQPGASGGGIDQSDAADLQLNQSEASEYPQPALFEGTLKEYQLKGMRWIANLFDSGINGILADEMGLGKTVQTIAFLAHLAEHYGIWGPFLVVGPASTLHNWQQEIARFCPAFKVVPYWGNPQDRKVLRTFWEQTNLATREASFHVVVTSYQLVVADVKYFGRVDWQCMVLDEAQAIKSSSSQRWKSLLGFRCRSRILLTGTPIQNSMAELWALLHFIMPSLFDSHREFSEWFSKDIENKAEHGGDIDQTHLSRLHIILKPFMLRRVKRDVENELSDKIEIMVYCPLTIRQRLLYQGLKKKISIDELLRSALGGTQQNQATTRLLNLVMQFRKVCNHPELFERRPVHSPVRVGLPELRIPRLLFRDGLLHRALPSRDHLLYHKFNVFQPEHVHRSLTDTTSLTDEGLERCSSAFSFLRFVAVSPSELCGLVHSLQRRWLLLAAAAAAAARRRGRQEVDRRHMLLVVEECGGIARPSPLLFTGHTSQVYAHAEHRILGRPETLEHRMLRTRKLAAAGTGTVCDPGSGQLTQTEPDTSQGAADAAAAATVVKAGASEEELKLVPEFPHRELKPQMLSMQPTELPAFLQLVPKKAVAPPVELYCSDRSAAWRWRHHQSCGSALGSDCVLYGSPEAAAEERRRRSRLAVEEPGGLTALRPLHGWSPLIIPDKRFLIADAGKLYVLDPLLKRLKEGGHRVLIYSQMTRMIDLLEEYMFYRQHKYKRLDGSSKIHERRDMVDDFQTRSDIFVFLLSTRAGGLGINLTAADTVIFYDSDWNPTVDQQAMDRAHRLGQTKQVTVYRLICKGTIEERILQRAKEKSEIQRMVIQGGSFRPDQLKAKEVVSLLLDDDVIEKKYRARQAETQERKRRADQGAGGPDEKRPRSDAEDLSRLSTPLGSRPPSRGSERSLESVAARGDTSPENSLLADLGTPPLPTPAEPGSFLDLHVPRKQRRPYTGRKRGRPRGSTSRGRGAQGRGRAASAAAAAEVPAGANASAEPGATALPGDAPRRRGRGRGRGRSRISTGRGRGAAGGGPGSRRPITLPVPLASSRYFQEKHQREGSSSGPSAFRFYTAPPDS